MKKSAAKKIRKENFKSQRKISKGCPPFFKKASYSYYGAETCFNYFSKQWLRLLFFFITTQS